MRIPWKLVEKLCGIGVILSGLSILICLVLAVFIVVGGISVDMSNTFTGYLFMINLGWIGFTVAIFALYVGLNIFGDN